MSTCSSAQANSDCPEYHTLKKCYSQVVDLVAQSPYTISNALFSKGLLSREELDHSKCTSRREIAQKIVYTVSNRILHTPHNYETFVQVLESEGDWTKDAVHSLTTTYGEERRNSPETHSPEAFPTHTTTKLPTSANGSDLDSDDSVKNVYEYADLEPLITEEQQNKSEDELRFETESIIFTFAGLILKLVAGLKRCNVTVRNLVFFLGQTLAIEPVLITDKQPGSLVDEKYLDDVARECKTIEEVFDKIKHYYSWFNHTLIEVIVIMFCSKDEEIQAAYDEYKQMFKSYCQNRLCRVPKGRSIFGNPRHQVKTVIFKVDQKWSKVKISQVSVIKTSICKIFHLKKSALFLRSARKGCVELIFDVPDFVAELILPLTPETEEALHKAGILEVYPISTSICKVGDPSLGIKIPAEEPALSFTHRDLTITPTKKTVADPTVFIKATAHPPPIYTAGSGLDNATPVTSAVTTTAEKTRKQAFVTVVGSKSTSGVEDGSRVIAPPLLHCKPHTAWDGHERTDSKHFTGRAGSIKNTGVDALGFQLQSVHVHAEYFGSRAGESFNAGSKAREKGLKSKQRPYDSSKAREKLSGGSKGKIHDSSKNKEKLYDSSKARERLCDSIKLRERLCDSMARERLRDSMARQRLRDSMARERLCDSMARERLCDSSKARERLCDSMARERLRNSSKARERLRDSSKARERLRDSLKTRKRHYVTRESLYDCSKAGERLLGYDNSQAREELRKSFYDNSKAGERLYELKGTLTFKIGSQGGGWRKTQ